MDTNAEALKIVEKQIDEKLVAFEGKIKGNFDTTDIKNELNALTVKFAEVTMQKDAVEKLSTQLDAIQTAQNLQGQSKIKSFNDIASDIFKEKQAELDRLKTNRGNFEFEVKKGQDSLINKTVGTVTLANVSGALPTTIGNVVSPLARKVHIRSLLSNSPITGATYSYPVIIDGEGSVGIQTEGSAKAQTDYDVTYELRSPIVFAHFQRYSNQILEDIPFLMNYISGRMIEQLLVKEDDEILNGAVGANRLAGILPSATAYVPTGSANVSTANRYSYLFDSISKLAQLNISASAILVNPYAYYEMLQIRTTALEYTAPVAGLTFNNGGLQFAGVPIVQSTAMAANAFCVGDWKEADLLTKSGMSVQMSTEDGDNFTKNLVTIRVEERIGLAIYRPTAFVYGTFTTIAS
jgi:HK97 family phage major capsid protein